MKILYAIQGTGNGHISRAGAILPRLRRYGKVDVLLSGRQVELEGDCSPKFRFQGMGFIFGKNGGVDLIATCRNNNLRRFKQEINSLPVHDYDLVISDFEPVSAWACLLQKKPCIGLSHQAAVLHQNAPQPAGKFSLGRAILRYYAPVSRQYGFHFQNYGVGIHTPVIRDKVRTMTASKGDHYTVYLPAYSDQRIIDCLGQIPDVPFEIFSKHAIRIRKEKNLLIRPIHDRLFLESMANSRGVLCGAGFETPAEALFLGKKLMVIPMKGQYEQQCNARALAEMDVPVLRNLSIEQKPRIEQWLFQDQHNSVCYPDETENIIDQLISETKNSDPVPATSGRHFEEAWSVSLFQKLATAYIRV